MEVGSLYVLWDSETKQYDEVGREVMGGLYRSQQIRRGKRQAGIHEADKNQTDGSCAEIERGIWL